MMTFEKETGHQLYVFIKRKTKQELNRRNARQNRVFIRCSVHLRWYDVLIVPLYCPSTQYNYKHYAYTVLLVLKSGQ